ncbi:MAG: hypothetical protein OXI63_02250 [Candidatus Poribacteria bacterium]|nr:hypothetical protein [Candidatus Poribacteria bacterium]
MKLRLGDVLIETNYIEIADKVAPHTVKLFFLSGATLDVHCGVKSDHPATWIQDAEGLLQTLENMDVVNDLDDE